MSPTAEEVRPTEEFRPLTDDELDKLSGGNIAENISRVAQGIAQEASKVGATIIRTLDWFMP